MTIRVSVLITIIFLFLSCQCKDTDMGKMIRNDLEVAGEQLSCLAEMYRDATVFPRSWKDGQYYDKDYSDWTSGFIPGSLWLYYEMTGDKRFAEQARIFTAKLKDVPFIESTHDLGFMVLNSYGRQYENDRDSVSLSALVSASNSLIKRFDERIGAIRSWDFGEWNYPVIIDNMMNLEMLFRVSELTGNPVYREVAVRHAETTLKNHFRDDASSYHVVSYNDDGSVERKCTYQGYSDSSHWARGQAWGLYGYTLCYRYTGEKRYLQQAMRIARMIEDQVLSQDAIPWWDYDDPSIPDAPKDASAAAVTASALLELQGMVSCAEGAEWVNYAIRILTSLSGEEYLSAPGENGFFVLRHSTGAAPFDSEIDVPLNYADYYFLEALQRLSKLKSIKTQKMGL